MSRTQGYTWEEVMLNIDIRNEAEKEEQQQQDILDKQAAEETAMGYWSLGLSLIGGALFGPAGYAAGKIAGRGIGDIRNTWETDVVDTGKFYKKSAEEFKKTRKKAADDQTSGQIVQGVTDLAMMYVQAGGLQEGPTDLTTFGSGGVEGGEWSFRGKGTPGIPGIPEGDPFYWSDVGSPYISPEVPAIPASEDYVPSLFSGWEKGEGFLKNLKPIGKKLKSANTGISSLQAYYESYLSSEEEKAAS